MKSLSCRDVGTDCDQKFTGQTEEEILMQAERHGREDHGIQEFGDDMRNKVRNAIRDIREDKGSQVA